MNKKLDKNTISFFKSVWKRRIMAEKGISEKEAEKIVKKNIEAAERMLYGHAMIAFNKQDGTFCMEQGTLIGYEKFFHRKFILTAKQESIIYWSEEQQAWRRFMIGNLLDWKPIV
ncbi:SH3 beta-barrel fold-containing protein [Bacteroides bouchesdurhonensis]